MAASKCSPRVYLAAADAREEWRKSLSRTATLFASFVTDVLFIKTKNYDFVDNIFENASSGIAFRNLINSVVPLCASAVFALSLLLVRFVSKVSIIREFQSIRDRYVSRINFEIIKR